MGGVPPLIVPSRERRTLDEVEIDVLLAQANGHRERAMIGLKLGTGIRIGELAIGIQKKIRDLY